VVTQLQIEKHHTNRLEILHGGTISTMIDLGGYISLLTWLTSSLAAASKGLFATGVSTDINISYLSSGGKVGDTITMESECDRLGTTPGQSDIRKNTAIFFHDTPKREK
jgi:acyl-coenzyme A thioesterase 13